jgi:hypothetical protein
MTSGDASTTFGPKAIHTPTLDVSFMPAYSTEVLQTPSLQRETQHGNIRAGSVELAIGMLH